MWSRCKMETWSLSLTRYINDTEMTFSISINNRRIRLRHIGLSGVCHCRIGLHVHSFENLQMGSRKEKGKFKTNCKQRCPDVHLKITKKTRSNHIHRFLLSSENLS